MDMSAVRIWLVVSQVLLASGALAVVLGAVGTTVFNSAREKLAIERVVAARGEPAGAQAAESTIQTLREANLALQSRLDATEQDRQAAANDLEATRLAHAKLREALTPRSLSEAQKDRLLAALKAIPGPPQVRMIVLGDPEANAYGSALVKVIEAAGYGGQLQNVPALVPPLYGVHITVKPADPKGAALKYAFGAVPIPVVVSEGPVGDFDAEIVVGLQPKAS